VPMRVIDPKANPRIDAAEEVMRMNDSPGVVWARFHEDVDQLLRLAGKLGRKAVRYDGRCSNQEKDDNLDAFQVKGTADMLIGNPASGGRGVPMWRAHWILNYSNYFSLLTRLQSEDRAEVKGKRVGTGIIDLVAEDTVDDTSIIPALRAKKSVVDYVMNERGGKWL